MTQRTHRRASLRSNSNCWSRNGEALKPNLPQKLRRFVVDGVGQHRPDASLLCNQHHAADGILQETKSDATPLILLRHCQSCQDHDRHRVLPHPFANALGCIQGIDLADGQAEIACYAVAVSDYKGLGRSTALGLPSVPQQPVIQGWFAAVKSFEPMLQSQRFWAAQAHGFSQGALRENRSRRPSLGCSGRSSRSIKARYWVPWTMNRRWSSKVCSAARQVPSMASPAIFRLTRPTYWQPQSIGAGFSLPST